MEPFSILISFFLCFLGKIEAPKKRSPTKSPYAKATDTGVDPEVAAKRLNIDWDSAADVEPGDENDEIKVPPAVVNTNIPFTFCF